MGSGQKFLTPGQVKFLLLWSGRVSHLWFGFGFGKFPLKIQKNSIFALWVKKNLVGSGQKVPGSKPGWPLIYCGSKVCSGQVRAHLYQKCKVNSTFFVVTFTQSIFYQILFWPFIHWLSISYTARNSH